MEGSAGWHMHWMCVTQPTPNNSVSKTHQGLTLIDIPPFHMANFKPVSKPVSNRFNTGAFTWPL